MGRLVETPNQIECVINAFLAQDGQLNVMPDGNPVKKNRVLVSGYDFLHDSSLKISQDYMQAGFTEFEDLDVLLDDPDPGQTGDEFSPSDLEDQLFPLVLDPDEKRHYLTNINTHANHFSFGTSIAEIADDILFCTDPSYDATHCYNSGINANTSDLLATVLYTSGCHSGLVVPSIDPKSLDLPEQMARKGVIAYIGNTGYGWGLRHGQGLTEKLMIKISGQLLDNDSISIGKALANAKRSYYLQEKRYDVFDEKVLHELSLFGIPNYLIVTNIAKKPDEPGLPGPAGPDEGCSEDICLTKRLTTASDKASLPPGVTELELNFAFGPATYQLVSTTDGDYYELNGQTSGEVGDTIQPHFVYNSSLSGTNAHSVLFTGGIFNTEASFDPVVAVPRSTNLDEGEGPLPLVSTFTPCIRVSYGTSGGSAQKDVGEVGYTNMVVHTGMFDNATGDQSRFDDMDFVIYYSTDPDIVSPAITDPGAGGFHTVNGLIAHFDVTVSDASGVFRVLVTYMEPSNSSWQSLDLVYETGSGTWQGDLQLYQNIIYYVQAVDNQGNVGMLWVTGNDLDGTGTPYGSTWSGPKTFDIVLADGDSDGLPDAYESQYACLDIGTPDADADPDYDYLTNANEFIIGCDPCQGDSDGGGDNDGSEYNNGRDEQDLLDDLRISIDVTKVDTTYTIDWNDLLGDNIEIDGYYFVYRSDTPFFAPADLVYGPLADLVKNQPDTAPPCDPCYYKVWNYQRDTPAPIVDVVVPNDGSAMGGTSVTVYGENFLEGAAVTFCGVDASGVIVNTINQIKCDTPPHAPGFCDVIVTNPNNQEGTLVNGFEYY